MFRGLSRKANVGISNDKWRGKRHRRKTKGSLIYVHRIRVSRDLRISRKVISMESGLIFLRLCILRVGDGVEESSRTYGIVR